MVHWYITGIAAIHDDVIKWKHFPRYWPFVRGIHRSPVNSPHKGQWHGALMFSLICVWIHGWVNNGEAGDLRRYRAHYDVAVMHIIAAVHVKQSRGTSWVNGELANISQQNHVYTVPMDGVSMQSYQHKISIQNLKTTIRIPCKIAVILKQRAVIIPPFPITGHAGCPICWLWLLLLWMDNERAISPQPAHLTSKLWQSAHTILWEAQRMWILYGRYG